MAALGSLRAEGLQRSPEGGELLQLHPRAIYDFLDALVALGFLHRNGDGRDGHYRNTAENATFLDRRSSTYIGGALEMANVRLYRYWGDLTEALRPGNILHDWDLDRKLDLIRSAYGALPEGGAFVVIEEIIDDARRSNARGLMVSLNMLIEFGGAFNFTGNDFTGWCRGVGFRHGDILPLAGSSSAGIAYK